jgi:hypothetical protein
MLCFNMVIRIDRLLVGVTLALCGLHATTAFAQASDSEKIDFAKQIAPIFEAKCNSCHGRMMRSGGVRLDTKEALEEGGYSQKPLLGGALATNEIYLRVSSNVPAYRMPKGGDPLTDEEVALIKQWVEQGTPWAETKIDIPEDQPDWFDQAAWLNYGEQWLNEVPGFIPWLVGMLSIMLFLLLIERYKQAAVKNRVWTTRRWMRWFTPLQRFGLAHFFLIAISMGWILTLLVLRGQTNKVRNMISQMKHVQWVNGQSPMQVNSVYGNPPIPHRPEHPPRLRGEYYRGNCERSPKLFNGGNYRTATLRVSLIDAQGRDVNYGDHIEPQSLSIRFELERPKGTAPVLYGTGIVKGVFLTPQLLPETMTKLNHAVTRLSEIKPGMQWDASVPLDGPKDATTTTLSGLIYVYQGGIEDNKARGTLHYGIKYDLNFKDLVLQPDSQVWLGSLFWSTNLEHPNQGKVPLKEWFDDQPIPEITGENSTDPQLLGIPEHAEKLKAK